MTGRVPFKEIKVQHSTITVVSHICRQTWFQSSRPAENDAQPGRLHSSAVWMATTKAGKLFQVGTVLLSCNDVHQAMAHLGQRGWLDNRAKHWASLVC